MSSRKRRTARKIAMLVRMDVSHHWCQMRWSRTDSSRVGKAERIKASMQALGRTMKGRVKDRAVIAINAARQSIGRPALK